MHHSQHVDHTKNKCIAVEHINNTMIYYTFTRQTAVGYLEMTKAQHAVFCIYHTSLWTTHTVALITQCIATAT